MTDFEKLLSLDHLNCIFNTCAINCYYFEFYYLSYWFMQTTILDNAFYREGCTGDELWNHWGHGLKTFRNHCSRGS